MIARLKGLVDSVAAEGCVVDVGGVGYLVFCSRRTAGQLTPGEAVALHVETQVREDHIHLFGFAEKAERDWFRLLTTVQGVGGRVALAILSVLDPDALATAIAAQDKAAVTRADGVGPKLAARIVSELKDKAGTIGIGAPVVTAEKGGAPAGGGASADAVSALVNLGYGRSEAFAAVAAASRSLGGEATVGALIPAALKELAP
ncbi:Holliday junction branch migration protein RuvA [Inquilinus sp. CAU 1745]|uniref:Holliday junction branch migration protein RuvA n=1 Tax=Inquilinus sp. CAU 1745 TaxID=3140369 RepID=UPI00325ABA07